jgi:hypothetical protein
LQYLKNELISIQKFAILNTFWQRFETGAQKERIFVQLSVESRMKYIHENPVRAGFVEKWEDYMCSSARNYLGLRGLIALDYW